MFNSFQILRFCDTHFSGFIEIFWLCVCFELDKKEFTEVGTEVS